MKHHLKHMAVAGGLVLAVLLVLRVDVRAALPYALLLACPLGMVGMMWMMSRQRRNGDGGHEHRGPGDGRGTSGDSHRHPDRADV